MLRPMVPNAVGRDSSKPNGCQGKILKLIEHDFFFDLVEMEGCFVYGRIIECTWRT